MKTLKEILEESNQIEEIDIILEETETPRNKRPISTWTKEEKLEDLGSVARGLSELAKKGALSKEEAGRLTLAHKKMLGL